MKYLILIHSSPAIRKAWEEFTLEEQMEFGRKHMAITHAMEASGELLASEGLADPSMAKCVTMRKGHRFTTDGPYPEVKEHLAGFYLVDCETEERALEWAARLPDVEYGPVEVRPILDLGFLEE